MAKNIEDTGTRLRTLLGLNGSAPQKGDKAGAFLWAALSDLWTYSANRVPEISDSIVEIDRAMRLGFNWELGPFELVGRSRRRSHRRSHEERRQAGRGQCRKVAGRGPKVLVRRRSRSALSGRKYWDLASSSWKPVEVPAGVWSVTVAKKSNGVVKKNSGASLVDLGDGVACIEFHSKMNSLGADIVSLIHPIAEARWSRRQLRRVRHHQRRDEFFRRRQSDAAAHERAGRRVGRRGPRHPPVPGDDAGHQVLAQASRLRAVRPVPGRRHRNFFARRGPPAARRTLHRPGRSRRRLAARRRRLQGDAVARRRHVRPRLAEKFPAKLSPAPSK